MSKKISGLKTEPVPSVLGSDSGGVLFTITIPDVPPSLNKVLRMHWAKKRVLLCNWSLLVRAQMPDMFLKPAVKMRCRVVLHHSRMYDKDNAYGACKVLVDALRAWKLIVDDTAEWLELSVEQAKCSHKTRHTVIEIAPCEERRN